MISRVALLVPGLLAAAAVAQNVIPVDGPLEETDLLAGVYDGQAFTLSPDTVFELLDGASIAPLGEAIDFDAANAVDFGGATINVHPGARIATEYTTGGSSSVRWGSFFENAVLNVRGGEIGRNAWFLSSPTITVSSGLVLNEVRLEAGVVTITAAPSTASGR